MVKIHLKRGYLIILMHRLRGPLSYRELVGLISVISHRMQMTVNILGRSGRFSISHFLKCRFLSHRAYVANFTRTILGIFSRLTKKVGRLFGLNAFSFEKNRTERKIPSEKRQNLHLALFLKRRFLGPSACYANLACAIPGNVSCLTKKVGNLFA